MLRTRVIPALLLRDQSLVKTIKFGKYTYIGDPCNTVRIFNELEVDELLFLDITATSERRQPNYDLLGDIASECFMPLAYGGGINSIEAAKKIFNIGFEKICLNSAALENPGLVEEIANHFGSQSVIISIDVKKSFFHRSTVMTRNGKKTTNKNPEDWAKQLESSGAGELLLTSIDREGTWDGFDVDLTKRVSQAVNIPVIAHGGCGSVNDIGEVIENGRASAVALGSMVVFQKKGMGVLVNFPPESLLKSVLP